MVVFNGLQFLVKVMCLRVLPVLNSEKNGLHNTIRISCDCVGFANSSGSSSGSRQILECEARRPAVTREQHIMPGVSCFVSLFWRAGERSRIISCPGPYDVKCPGQ